jgi:hypothetical protein
VARSLAGDVVHDSLNAFEAAAFCAGAALAWVEQVGLRGTSSILDALLRRPLRLVAPPEASVSMCGTYSTDATWWPFGAIPAVRR